MRHIGGLSPVFGPGAYLMWQSDFSSASFGSYSLSSSKLSYKNASAIRFYQQDAGTGNFINSIDTPVISTIDGYNRGLLIEEKRSNALTNPRTLTGWSSISGTVTGSQVGIDGTSTAFRHQGTATDRTKYFGVVLTGNYTLSVYYKTTTSSNVRAIAKQKMLYSACTNNYKRSFIADSSFSGALVNIFLGYGLLWNSGGQVISAEAFDYILDCPQLENGNFPTSFIIGTRSGGALRANGTDIVFNNSVHLDFTIQMLSSCGGINDNIADLRILKGGSSTASTITINKSTGVITIVIGESTATFDPITWSVGDILRFRIIAGTTSNVSSVYLKKNSTAWIWLGDSDLPQGNFDNSGVYDILSDYTNIEAIDSSTPRQANCILMNFGVYKNINPAIAITDLYSGDKSVAKKIMSGDKVSLCIVGDSRLNFDEFYFGKFWNKIPISGVPLELSSVAGVSRPWTAYYTYTNIDTPVLLQDGSTYLGNIAPFSCQEIITSSGSCPVDSVTPHGTPLLPNPTIAFNPFNFTTESWVNLTTPQVLPRVFSLFANDVNDVYLKSMIHQIPTGHVGGLQIQLRPDKTIYGASGAYRSIEFGSYSASPSYSVISVQCPANWSSNQIPGIELIGVPGSSFVNNKTIRVVRTWIERASYGVTLHNFSVGGRTLNNFLNVSNLWSSTLWSNVISNLTGEKILWLDLGTNDIGISVATHKANIQAVITNFRSAIPNGKVIITTAYERSTDIPGTRPNYAQAAWDIAVDFGSNGGVLCLDTYTATPTYTRANTLGWMADTVHYSSSLSAHCGLEEYAKKIDYLLSNI